MRRLCPCCPQGQLDVEAGQVDLRNVEPMPATYDNGHHEVCVSVCV